MQVFLVCIKPSRWFLKTQQVHAEIKLKPQLEHGPIHLFNELTYINRLQATTEEKNVLRKKLQNNSYYAHPEFVILASLGESLYFIVYLIYIGLLISLFEIGLKRFNSRF